MREVRDLLVPVAGANKESNERQVALDRHREQIRASLSSDKRKAAWRLSDGSRSQRQIAQESGLDEGNASRFFKQLRDIHAITDTTNPTRALEVE